MLPLYCNDDRACIIIVRMSDSYHIDLQHIPLDEYKQTLKAAELIPSRRILKEQIDDRFSRLQAQGIANLAKFLEAVKSTGKIDDLAGKTYISVEYLTLLRREVNALLPNPKNLKNFPGIEPSIVEKLAARGIKNSKQLFESALTRRQRAEVVQEAGIDPEVLLELVKLSDLSRIYGVGPIFARLLYDAGYDSVEAIARADSPALFGRLSRAYLAAGNSRVDFTERDIAFCIQMAGRLAGS
jgi:predicted flap endonuclease-1-like 5' DNA nuclease